MSSPRTIKGRGIVKGQAAGPALVAREPVSFLGDLDIRTGTVVGDLPSVKGESVAGKVLVMPASRGSAGAWRFLYQLCKHQVQPVALVCRDLPDPSVVQGAILGGIPVVCDLEEDVVETIEDGDPVEVDGSGLVRVGGGGAGP